MAHVWLASRHASEPRIPPPVHGDEEVVDWFASIVFPSDQEVWVIERQRRVVAILVMQGSWIEQLYVHPDWTGRRLGSGLVDLAKDRRTLLQLWSFQSNTGARRFYERHGFVAREMTEGLNEEGAPDVRYEWRRR